MVGARSKIKERHASGRWCHRDIARVVPRFIPFVSGPICRLSGDVYKVFTFGAANVALFFQSSLYSEAIRQFER